MENRNAGFLQSEVLSNALRQKITSLISEYIIDLPVEKIDSFYQKFTDMWDADDCDIKEPDAVNKIKGSFFVPKEVERVGIDLPVWYNVESDPKQKKIMFVGIDPLRAEHCKVKNSIYFGCPYAFHNKVSTLLPYRGALEALIAEGVAVYFTDTFKVYYWLDGKQSSKIRSFTHHFENLGKGWQDDVHQVIFKKEVEAFSPDLIITMGKTPLQWFSSKNITEPAVTFKGLLKEDFSEWPEDLHYQREKIDAVRIFPIPHLARGNIKALNAYLKDQRYVGADTVSRLMKSIVNIS
jgi:hypothetical protein